MKKYDFTGETKLWCGRTLHRIRAVVAFGDVAEGSTVVGMIAENASAIEELSETLEWGSF